MAIPLSKTHSGTGKQAKVIHTLFTSHDFTLDYVEFRYHRSCVPESAKQLFDNQALGATLPAVSLPKSGGDNGRNGSCLGKKETLPCEQCEQLLPVGVVVSDAVLLHTLYQKTLWELESYEKRAREGKDLMPALDFARFVTVSGIAKLLKQYPADGTLKVDGAFLEWKANEVKAMVQQQFVTGQIPGASTSDLQEIRHKLDLIAGYLSVMHKSTEPHK